MWSAAVLLVAWGTVCCAAEPSVASTRKQYTGYKVFSATPLDEEALSMLQHLLLTDVNIDFWQEPSKVGEEVHMMVSPQQLSRVEALLRGASIEYKTLYDNVEDQLTEMWKAIDSRSQKAFVLDDYNTLDDIYSWLDSLVGSCREGFECEVYSAGNSYEGRPLKIFKISKPGENRKGYFVDATIHAREWIATATSLKILNHTKKKKEETDRKAELVTGGDADAVALTEAYDWYFLPVVNPDGYAYTWTTDRLWRKNRTPNSGSTCYGTDLNRNFAYSWGTDGVSFNPCSATYCGSSAGSEPETVVQSAELLRLAPSLIGLVTVHSYGNYFMFSWGTTVDYAGAVCQRTDDHDELLVVANAAADAIQATYGTTWRRGNSCETIYPTSGSTQDYAKGAAGIKYSFTPELRGSSFVIDSSNIPLSFNEVWNGIVAMTSAINA